MQNDVQVFQNGELGSVRVAMKEDGLHFVAKDVAESLGYAWAGSATIKHVPTEWIGVNSELTPSGKQTMLTLSEQGLYFFLGRSDKKKALEYQKWIAGEVVPSIMRTGSYSINKPLVNMPNFEDPAEMAEEWARQYRQNKALEMEVQQKALALEEAAPKVEFANAVEASDTCILIGQLAKLLKQNGYDTGQTRLFNWLRNNGYLMRQNGNNVPTQYSMELGLMVIREKIERNDVDTVNYNRIFITPMVTGKGQLYFINKLCGTKFKSLPA